MKSARNEAKGETFKFKIIKAQNLIVVFLLSILITSFSLTLPIVEAQLINPIKSIEVFPSRITRLRGDGAIYHVIVETGVDMAKAIPPPVELSVSGLPPKTSAKIERRSGRPLPLFHFTLSIKTDEKTPAGTYSLRIIASSGAVQKSVIVTLKLVDRTEDGASLVLYDSYAKSLDVNFWTNMFIVALTMYGSDYMNSFTNPFAILKKFITGLALKKYSMAEQITKQVVTLTSALKSGQVDYCLGATNPGINIPKELREIASLIEQGNRKEAIPRISRLIPALQKWLKNVDGLVVDGLVVSDVSKQTTQNLIKSTILFLEGELARLEKVPPTQGVIGRADVVLVIDVSGSMGDAWQGEIKLNSAKKSAKALVDVMLPGDRIAVVTFQSSARTELSLTSDFSMVKKVIDNLRAGGNTNIGEALMKALSELETHGRSNAMKTIIFFTDGHITTGMREKDVLAGPVKEAADKKIIIYTVGYGDPNYLREEFLRKMAEATGGKYYYATEAYQLQNVFIEAAQMAGGWKIEATFTGSVKQGEMVTAGTFDVVPGTKSFRVVLNWPGSNLDLKIFDPTGMELDLAAPNVIYSGDVKPEYVIISDPLPGTWSIKVYGKMISLEERYYIWVSTYAPRSDLFSPIGKYIVPLVLASVLLLTGFFTWRTLSGERGKRLKQLRKLEEMYRQGRISEETYRNLRSELEEKERVS